MLVYQTSSLFLCKHHLHSRMGHLISFSQLAAYHFMYLVRYLVGVSFSAHRRGKTRNVYGHEKIARAFVKRSRYNCPLIHLVPQFNAHNIQSLLDLVSVLVGI